MKWPTLIICISFFISSKLSAMQQDIRDDLQHLEEKLREHIDDGFISKNQLVPLTVVEVKTEGEDQDVLLNALVQTLGRAIQGSVLICDACQGSYEQDSLRTTYESGFTDLNRVREIYDRQGLHPQAALWARQTGSVLSVRIVSLQNNAVLFADSIDQNVDWSSRSVRSFSQSRKAERQARGDAIIHGHWDIGLNPFTGGTHIGYSLMQQWGSANQYLSGFSFNVTDPVAGFGVNFFQAMPKLGDALLGGKVLMSIPKAISKSASGSDSNDSSDKSQLFNLVIMAKYPLFEQPELFYINVFFSTNGIFGAGLSW